ncbi:putative Sister chromatid cohesion protein [Naja naja]|nr:putative Sister chromatid cohesion protein [Naja naja]
MFELKLPNNVQISLVLVSFVLQKLYTVCDVALCVINSKSALCNAECPKDPVLPTKFLRNLKSACSDKLSARDFCNDRNYISEELRVLLLTGKPKPTGVLGAVNKPLSATGRRPYIRNTGSETGNNNSVNSELNSPIENRTSREPSSDLSETGVSENDENPVRIISVTPTKMEPVKNKVWSSFLKIYPVKKEELMLGNVCLKISIRRVHQAEPYGKRKLVSLLPEYVVPYMIHLLAHDPDFTKQQDIDQLRYQGRKVILYLSGIWVFRCLWFMLEVLMTKNENNSHAFMKKMTESIKLTQDAQSPDEPKANEKLYTVCDVALCVINSKSALCNAECPKDPVLPTKFFAQPEKPETENTKDLIFQLNNEMHFPFSLKDFVTIGIISRRVESSSFNRKGIPKPTGVLGAVNKPLSATGRRPYIRNTGSETGNNNSVNSELNSPIENRTRNLQRAELRPIRDGVSENDENPVRIISVTPTKMEPVKNKEINSDQAPQENVSADRGKKRITTAAGTENFHQKAEEKKTDETGQPAAPKPRRGRPPKSESQGATTKSAEMSKPPGRGRKRAAPAPEGPGGLETSNAKAPKQQETTKKTAPAQRQIDLQRSQVLGSDGDSVLEIESSPGYSANEMDLFKLCESSQEDLEERALTEAGSLKVHEAADSGLRKKKTFSQKEERRAKGRHAPSFCKTQEMSYIGTENTSDHKLSALNTEGKLCFPFR